MENLTEEGVRTMSDNELSDTLVSLGFARTPVTYTTRPWLEKKLMDKMNWREKIDDIELNEKKCNGISSSSSDEINNSINELIIEENKCRDEKRIYYAVFCPDDCPEDGKLQMRSIF
jgi:hypothetical protein